MEDSYKSSSSPSGLPPISPRGAAAGALDANNSAGAGAAAAKGGGSNSIINRLFGGGRGVEGLCI
jgi:hypothetical protein